MILASTLILCAAVGAVATAQEGDFTVAPGGNDAWTGRLPAPNAAGTNGPFATLGRARDAVRDLRRDDPQRTAPVTIRLRGGMYELPDTLRFTTVDSGTEASPTIYAAHPGETPVISGGRRLTGWKVTPDGRWELTLPEVAAGEWDFAQLFINGQRRYRPRWPEEGFSFITAEAPSSPEVGDKGYDRFHYRAGDVDPDWANLQDVELLTFHTWTMDRTRIKSVDRETLTVQRSAPTLAAIWYFNLAKGSRFLCDNVKEALRKPGQWYLDRPTGVLTYLPLPGETPETAEVIAPRVDMLVRLAGDPTIGMSVQHLRFEGLTFAYSQWEMTPEGNRWGQAEVGLPGAIQATGARNCTWDSCRIEHVGTYGLELGRGCYDNRVVGCEITDLGAGGVRLGEPAYAQEPEEPAGRNVVEDCLIAHGGRLHPAGIGVWIGHSPHNRVSHNEVCDFYYSGFSVGWSWGYGPSHAHDNLIEFNEVHDIGQGVLSDMGGIYTLGVSPGTVIRNNRFHDIDAFGYGGWGIYLDEGSSGILAEDNITYNTQSPGYRIHYGRDNTAVNNVFALSQEAPLGRLRAEPHLSFTVERNLIYWTEGQALGENWEGTRDNFRLDRNLYWCPNPALRVFAGRTFEEWQATGQDTHSLVADPLFTDPAKGDFGLPEGSPAAQIGFRPIDTSTVGRRNAPGARTPTALPRAFPAPMVPPPLPIREDFEALQVGDKPPGAQVIEEGEIATIRVTDELAAGGRQCLKIVDVPGQKGEYNPHFFYEPNFVSGLVRGSFDLRVEQGTYMYHEWRDYSGGPYRIGPALHALPDGRLVASGQTLLPVPYGKWMHVEITCGLGPDLTGTWNLSLRVEGEDVPLEYKDLPCAPGFKMLSWFGFTANADAPGLYYLDTIRLEPVEG